MILLTLNLKNQWRNQTKQNQTCRYRKQSSGQQRGKGEKGRVSDIWCNRMAGNSWWNETKFWWWAGCGVYESRNIMVHTWNVYTNVTSIKRSMLKKESIFNFPSLFKKCLFKRCFMTLKHISPYVKRKASEICCETQGAQINALWPPGGGHRSAWAAARLTHVGIRQKLAQYRKAIILQLKI